MVVATKHELTQAAILRWLQDFMLAHDEQPTVAANRVVEQIESDGLEKEFLRQFGQIAIMAIWHDYTQMGRPHSPLLKGQPAIAHAPSPNGTAQSNGALDRPKIEQGWPDPQAPRGAAFKSPKCMLDVLYKVGKVWLPLGGMNKPTLLQLSGQYQTRANSNETMATWTRRLADSLKGDKAVLSPKQWTDEVLMELFKASVP